MRYLLGLLALLLVTIHAQPALAGAGFPQLASLKIGSYTAVIRNDSPTLQTGANGILVEVAELLPEGAKVSVHFVGPGGQKVDVVLKPVTVLPDEDGGHGEEADSHDAPKDSHEAPKDSHGAANESHGTPAPAPAAKTDDHGKEEAGHGEAESVASNLFRGKVNIPVEGTWSLTVEIANGSDHGDSAKTTVVAEKGGPNTAFVTVSGLIMGGSMLYGVIQRRKK